MSRSKPALVAMCGHIGSGKSTVAAMLREHGYSRTRFADPLKAMCRALGLTEAEVDGDLKELPCPALLGRTPRDLQRFLGTEVGRTFHPNLWTHLWYLRAEEAIRGGGLVAVDDLRFPNEVEVLRGMSALIVRIERPGKLAASSHQSDTYVDSIEADAVIYNDGSLSQLSLKVAGLISP